MYKVWKSDLHLEILKGSKILLSQSIILTKFFEPLKIQSLAMKIKDLGQVHMMTNVHMIFWNVIKEMKWMYYFGGV